MTQRPAPTVDAQSSGSVFAHLPSARTWNGALQTHTPSKHVCIVEEVEASSLQS